jgi:hypothetical protein
MASSYIDLTFFLSVEEKGGKLFFNFFTKEARSLVIQFLPKKNVNKVFEMFFVVVKVKLICNQSIM